LLYNFAASVLGAILGHGNVLKAFFIIAKILKAFFIIAKKHRINFVFWVGLAGNKFRR